MIRISIKKNISKYMNSNCLELVFESVTGEKRRVIQKKAQRSTKEKNNRKTSLHTMLAWNWTLG